MLFACGLSPFATVEELDADDCVALAAEAARQLRANLDHPGRVTAQVPGGMAVYGRNGQLCHRCGGRIEAERMGTYARTTYYCPTCQHRGDHRVPAEIDDELAWSSSSRKLGLADPHPAASKYLRELPNRGEPVGAADAGDPATLDEVDLAEEVVEEASPRDHSPPRASATRCWRPPTRDSDPDDSDDLDADDADDRDGADGA